VIEFDDRCSCEERDNLNIVSWYNKHKTTPTTGNISNSFESMGTKIKFNGSNSQLQKKRVFFFGNCLSVNVNSSPLVQDHYSLLQWGFKLYIRPMYGFGENLEKIVNESKFPKNLKDMTYHAINSVDRFSVSFLQCLDLFLGGGRTTSKEKEMASLMEQTMIKNGLKGIKKDRFLKKHGEKHILADSI